MENKKVALIFLYFIGAIQLVAGVYTQLVGLFHWDFMSLFPVVEMGTQQILYLNLLAVFLVTTLIHIVVAALVKEGSIGGGDIKLMGACGFVLGVKRGYIALMLGLFLAVLFQTAYAKKEDKGFAMAPYLALGCLLAMLPA